MFSWRTRIAIPWPVLSAAAAASVLCSSVGARAVTPFGNEVGELVASCGDAAGAQESASTLQPSQVARQTSKSVAILGGQPSALDQILAQQSAGSDFQTATALAFAEPLPAQPLEPALGGLRPRPTDCSVPLQSQAGRYGSGDFLASKRLAISRTPYDREWRRVSGDRVSARRYRNLVGEVSTDRVSTMRSVNSWVNRSIAFTEDRDLFSRADFWAGAATTLRLRRGDCEDIALTKMQLLAAAGIPREDMVLTIARDLVRNADHAVLMVRHDGGYYMLDNASDELFDGSRDNDYRPILSFGGSQAWLHGY